MKAEFDSYIKDYRKDLDNHLSLSGENSSFFAEYKALKLKEWLGAQAVSAQKILDFGCGDGLMTNFVSNILPNAQLYGVDPSYDSISVAQKNYPHLKLSVSYEEKYDLDFSYNYFDIIFAAGAFHHIPFEHHTGFYKELFRILKPNGAIVTFELNPFNPLTYITFKRNPIDQHATMLKPWYAYCLGKAWARKRSLKFYCFYPNVLRGLRFTEKYLTKFPIGALYATIFIK